MILSCIFFVSRTLYDLFILLFEILTPYKTMLVTRFYIEIRCNELISTPGVGTILLHRADVSAKDGALILHRLIHLDKDL